MNEWWEITLVVLGGIITIFTVWEKIESRTKKIQEPTSNLEERVSLIERKLEFEIKGIFAEYDMRFGRDKTRLDSIEDGNRVTQRALLALLEHSIDGNNTEALNKAKNELNDYLIKR